MLQKLMETIPQKKYVAFGSNKNDVSMVSAADLSFATVDAIPEVAEVADKRMKSHGGDAVVRKMHHLYERLPWQKLPAELREPEKREE